MLGESRPEADANGDANRPDTARETAASPSDTSSSFDTYDRKCIIVTFSALTTAIMN